RGEGPTPDHEVDALRLARVVVVEKELRLLCKDGFALLVIAVFGAAGGADHLLTWNAVDALGIDAHEILATGGDDVSLETVGAQIAQYLLHRLIGELRIRP